MCAVGRVRAASQARLSEWGQPQLYKTSNFGLGGTSFGEVERMTELPSSRILKAVQKTSFDQLSSVVDVQNTKLSF